MSHQPSKEAGIFDERYLDSLSHASAAFTDRQRAEKIKIVDHTGGGRKGAQEGFGYQCGDAIFYSNPRIVLSQDGGGQTQKSDTSMGCGGNITHGVDECASP